MSLDPKDEALIDEIDLACDDLCNELSYGRLTESAAARFNAALDALRARLEDGPTVDVRGFLWCPSDMDTVFLVPSAMGMAPDIEMGVPEGLLILARSLDGRRVIASVCTRLLPTGEVQHTLVAIRPEGT